MSKVSTADLLAAKKILTDLDLGEGESASQLAAIANLLEAEVAKRRQKAIRDKISEEPSFIPRRVPFEVVQQSPRRQEER